MTERQQRPRPASPRRAHGPGDGGPADCSGRSMEPRSRSRARGVLATDIDLARAERAAEAIRREAPDAEVVARALDVTDEASVRRLADAPRRRGRRGRHSRQQRRHRPEGHGRARPDARLALRGLRPGAVAARDRRGPDRRHALRAEAFGARMGPGTAAGTILTIASDLA